MIPEPTGAVVLADGRRLAYDDVGDPAGVPVVYLHGCPDCRLARHPDDDVARAAGVRLIAVDRPGYGSSDADDDGDEATQADDLVALADALGVDKFVAFGWSSGGPGALAVAARHPDRALAVGVAAGQVPIEADADPEVFAAIDPVITMRGEIMRTMSPNEFAAMAAPLVAPVGADEATARAVVLESKDEAFLADLATVDGLLDQFVLTVEAATGRGLDGVERDMRSMVSPWPFDLGAITAPVVLWYGGLDQRFRPPAGQWLADRIPGARLVILERASHLLPLVHWRELLDELASLAHAKEPSHAPQP